MLRLNSNYFRGSEKKVATGADFSKGLQKSSPKVYFKILIIKNP
jgi:hypothetical protein